MIILIVWVRKLRPRDIKSLAQAICSGSRNQTPVTLPYTCPLPLHIYPFYWKQLTFLRILKEIKTQDGKKPTLSPKEPIF